jgi:serine/threonine protein kinase
MQNGFGATGEDGQPIYCLHEILSKNALGVVYAASERATGRKFMVQFMSGQAGEEQTQAIERGMEKLVALPHPNILHVQGTGRRKNRLYLMMDFVEAPSLGDAKIREVPRICSIIRDAAAAIHYAHEEGIHHGGVNLDTILVAQQDGKDVALVKEFGLGFIQELSIPSTPGRSRRRCTATPPTCRRSRCGRRSRRSARRSTSMAWARRSTARWRDVPLRREGRRSDRQARHDPGAAAGGEAPKRRAGGR